MKVSIQGIQGSYSDQAAAEAYPSSSRVYCTTFKKAIALLEDGVVDRAFLPIENSTAFRVTEVHNLLRGLEDIHIVKELSFSVQHALLGIKGAKLSDITEVCSHPQALMQCQNYCYERGIAQHAVADTAGSAKHIAEMGDLHKGAIASVIASDIYNLDILDTQIQDKNNNVTTFLGFKKTIENLPYVSGKKYKTALIFTTRNISSSLYKALGGFATNHVNLTKLESYTGTQQAEFFVIFEGHLESENVRHAMEELRYFSENVKILGSYPVS